MYLSFYGLTEKPFSQTPDPKFLYWNDAYRETIASLRYGIQERKGFVTMIGEAGTGKTTLLRKLLDDLGPDVVSVFLFNPNASFEEILEYTLSELGIPAAAGRKLAMMQRLNDFLLAAFQEGKNTILLIDEAQDLETEVLESLRLLSNLETAKEKILQIVLSGQPELATRLAQPNLRQLKQRIAVRCRIEPLGRHELADYIAARLSVAGGRGDLFAAATLDPIWEFARGIPRLINTVCDNALLVGYALGRQTIDTEVIGEVVADLGRIDAPLDLPTLPPLVVAAPPPPAAAAPPAASTVPIEPAPVPVPVPASPATSIAEPRFPSAAAPPASPTAAPLPRPTVRTAGARPTVEPVKRRRRGALVVTALLLVALLAAGAWASRRWDELRPRLQQMLGEPTIAYVDTPPAGLQARAAHPEVDPAPAPAAVAAVSPEAAAQAAGGPAVAPVVAPIPSAAAVDATAPAPFEDAAPEPRAALRLEPAAAPAAEAAQASPVTETPSEDVALARQPSQDLQAGRRAGRAAKRIMVQRGDTLMNLAAREYGYATYTVLDVVRSANPDIVDVNRIIAGSELVFPDPGPEARVVSSGDDVSILVATTPVLVQAQEIQRLVGSRYRLPADLEPVALGDGRSLYRVSLRKVADQAQARQIAESLGSILRDPS